MKSQAYDIIGDIHGQSDELVLLLEKLGYEHNGRAYSHGSRKVIFLGDFIDRGSQQREVISIVKPMIEHGYALSVMGNHEFNAIAYFTLDDDSGQYFRPHTDKNAKQHKAFLDAYAGQDDYPDVIAWFKTLPLWLEIDGLRVVHACWDPKWISFINDRYVTNNLTSAELLSRAATDGTEEFEAIETLLKGKEIPLADGVSFKDKDGNTRHNIRVRWWDASARTYKQAFMGPESALTHIPDDEIKGDHLIDYSHNDIPVFLGHYWMTGKPEPLAENIACLDYSVAKPGGKLVAYRWDGEKKLDSSKYVSVYRDSES